MIGARMKVPVLMAAAALAAQVQTSAQPAAPRAGAPPAHIPSLKELKFPPLGTIQIPDVTTVTLPNGMKLFLLEDHALPIVNGAARVRTGNLFDPPDKIGLATLTGMTMRTGGTQKES